MTHPELKPFQAIILVLSIVAVGALAVELVFTVPAEAQRVMRWIDNIICVVLLIDFSIRFYRAESKLEFMKWGWIELLASIPEVEALRWGRLFRVFRILRIILITRSMRQYLTELFNILIALTELLQCKRAMPKELDTDCFACFYLHSHIGMLVGTPVLVLNKVVEEFFRLCFLILSA